MGGGGGVQGQTHLGAMTKLEIWTNRLSSYGTVTLSQ